jgi:long-chain-fatty-acid--[acyl-carrier-protein] ligase
MISLPAVEAVLNTAFASADEEGGPSLAVEAVGEESRAEIVLATTKEITREEANAAIREEGLSALYNIRRVVKLDEIPVLGTGKTNYRELKKRLS